jgi:hypothetical protein
MMHLGKAMFTNVLALERHGSIRGFEAEPQRLPRSIELLPAPKQMRTFVLHAHTQYVE